MIVLVFLDNSFTVVFHQIMVVFTNHHDFLLVFYFSYLLYSSLSIFFATFRQGFHANLK